MISGHLNGHDKFPIEFSVYFFPFYIVLVEYITCLLPLTDRE